MAPRGPDDSRIVDTGKGFLGFHRLAIMGMTDSGMQPFRLDGNYIVCNGKIYGYEKVKSDLIAKVRYAGCRICADYLRRQGKRI